MEIRGSCQRCKSKWVVTDKRWKPGKLCPFCGESLLRRDTIEELLRSLVATEGAVVLRNSSKINGMLADFFPQEGQKRSAIRMALDMKLGEAFYVMAEDSEADRQGKVANIKWRLKSEAWLSEEACDYICAVFLSALDLDGDGFGEEGFTEGEPAEVPRQAGDSRHIIEERVGKPGNRDVGVFSDDALEAALRQWIQESRYSGGEELVEEPSERGTGTQGTDGREPSGRGTGTRKIDLQADTADNQGTGMALGAQRDFTAAASGDAEAAFRVGYRFETGTGMPKSQQGAMTWYEEAAKLGSAEALHTLGYFYYRGQKGVPQNFEKAFHYFEAAAQRGNVSSMRNLGVMYENGEFVTLDLVKAAKWYQKAEEKGDVEAKVDHLRVQGRIYALYANEPETTWEECLKKTALNSESKVYVRPHIPDRVAQELLNCWTGDRKLWSEPIQAILIYRGKGNMRAIDHFDGIVITPSYLLHATKAYKSSVIEFDKIRDVRERRVGAGPRMQKFLDVVTDTQVINTFISAEWYHLEPLSKKLKQSGKVAECKR